MNNCNNTNSDDVCCSIRNNSRPRTPSLPTKPVISYSFYTPSTLLRKSHSTSNVTPYLQQPCNSKTDSRKRRKDSLPDINPQKIVATDGGELDGCDLEGLCNYQQISIDFLPSEVMLQILSHIDFLFVHSQLSLVCKYWFSLARDPSLSESLDFTSGGLKKTLCDTSFRKSMQLFCGVKSINLSSTDITVRGVEIISRSCLNLEKLSLSHCPRLKPSVASFDSLLFLPKLTSLNLIGTLRVVDSNIGIIDSLKVNNIKHLGVSAELMNYEGSALRIDYLAKNVRWLGLRVSHLIANDFLQSPNPFFASSLVSLEVGSRSGGGISNLPATIGMFTSLTSLVLSSHHFTHIPPEIGNLKKLRYLAISGARVLNRTLPSSQHLSSTLHSIPEEITQLPLLETLNLSFNRIHTLPPTIYKLSSLVKLNVSENNLEDLPESLGLMTKLQRLDVSHNNLKELPSSMNGLHSLYKFKAAHNKITGFPAGFFEGLKSLEHLDLQENCLHEIPETVSFLGSHLKSLCINNNKLEFLPESLGSLTLLRRLSAHCNRLREIPSSIGNLTLLKALSLYSNSLSSLPSSLVHLKRLHTLELGSNVLIQLPYNVSCMQGLRRVELQDNSFSTLEALQGLASISSLKSLRFDWFLVGKHQESCMCKFCIFSRFDEAHFDDIVEGDNVFGIELVELFFQCMEADFLTLQQHISQNNFAGIFFVAHKIKGTLSNIGAVKLSCLCLLLERYSKDQDLYNCIQQVNKLKREYEQLKTVLQRRMAIRS
eukprot:TRINITY_DN324_c0_g3_i1.p1 TRINITY_DN324_c0_g3~~TRINITY_DN324_c0_g3_i1.p1  ORF type:complete len:768 (+),score=115.97 TRINITY_DN324_c0_g3_i1:217-2520(+)